MGPMRSFNVGEKSVLILVRRALLRKSGGGAVGRGCVRDVEPTHECVCVCVPNKGQGCRLKDVPLLLLRGSDCPSPWFSALPTHCHPREVLTAD